MTLPIHLFALLLCSPLVQGQRHSTIARPAQPLLPPDTVIATLPDPFFVQGARIGHTNDASARDDAVSLPPRALYDHNQFPLVRPVAADAQNFDMVRYFGNLSPWRSIPSSNYGLPMASPIAPDGCQIVQVHLLHRHGARFPSQSSNIGDFVAKVREAASSSEGLEANGDLAFLRSWRYDLGTETLTPFGRAQLFNLGTAFRVRYGKLLKGFDNLPVFRTTSQSRMLDSALHFSAGFFGLYNYANQYHQLVEVEADGMNSTLSPRNNCPNACNEISEIGHRRYSDKWVERYLAGAQERLGRQVPGFNLTIWDCLQMQQLCAFETAAFGHSRFCGLFTEDEWKGYAYANALFMWYGSGPGSPTSAAVGKGYVQELVSRLTKKRITEFYSSVNRSIVTDEMLFPFNQPLYVDATHDTVMSGVYVAMNFTSFIRSGPLPIDRIPDNLSYNTNEVMPFAASLVGQVLSCPSSSSVSPTPPLSTPVQNVNKNNPTHIRWILNDGVLPLTGIQGCEPNQHGLCEIDAFIEGMKTRIKDIDFEFACFGNYTFPDPDKIVDGRLPM